MEAAVNREENEKKAITYWCHSTGFNEMCYKCPLLGSRCIGSRNYMWHDCVKRNAYERGHNGEE